MSFSHCIWNSKRENDLIQSTGATVIHNPVSNLKLGSGIADAAGFVKRGIPLAFGTDGAASNDSLSIQEVMKTACLVGRIRSEEALTSVEALMAATVGGAGSAGLKSDIAVLEPGRLADLILIPKLNPP